MKDVYYMSESDYPFTAISAANPEKKPLSGALVFSQFKGAIEELFKDDVNEVKYQDMAFEVDAADGMDFIAERTRAEDPSDPDWWRRPRPTKPAQDREGRAHDVQVVKVGPGRGRSLASDQGLYGLLTSAGSRRQPRRAHHRLGRDLTGRLRPRPGARPLRGRGRRRRRCSAQLQRAPPIDGLQGCPRHEAGPAPSSAPQSDGLHGCPGTEAGTEAGRSVARACRRSARSSRT
jgi:hypothetical protein